MFNRKHDFDLFTFVDATTLKDLKGWIEEDRMSL